MKAAEDSLKGFKNTKKFTEPMRYPIGSYYSPRSANDRTLVFESRFESGNLQLVHKKSDEEYDCVLQNDINSKGHTQWFYFRVSNTYRGMKVKFNLLNMIKSKSLYNDGMKVLIYSNRRNENMNRIAGDKTSTASGWIRGG
jgi:hypothetical protein